MGGFSAVVRHGFTGVWCMKSPPFSTHFCLRLVKEMMDRTDPDPLIRTGEQLCLKTLDIAPGLQYGIRYRCNLEQGNQFHGLHDFGVRRRSWP